MRASAIVGNCIFLSSLPGSVSCQLMPPSLEKSTRDTPSSPPNAMPRPECRSAGLKSMKQSSCAAFGLAGPSYAKAQTSPRDRERRGAFRSSGPLLARNGPPAMSESSPLSGLEQKSNLGAIRREITFVLGFQSSCSNSVARRLDKPTAKLGARIS